MKKLFILLLLMIPLTIGYSEPTPQPTLFAVDAVDIALDGSPANVISYTIYCGTATKTYTITKIFAVTDPDTVLTSSNKFTYPIAKVLNMADGTYYCSATAINVAGESGYSGELSFLVLAGQAIGNADLPAVPAGFKLL